jgi:MFS family permease
MMPGARAGEVQGHGLPCSRSWEIRLQWRYLAAASLGQTAGYSTLNYINNLFTPKLINDFHWSRSDVALIGTTAFFSIACQPIAGRLTDSVGVKRMVIVGVICAPLILVALGAMTGSLIAYFLLSLLQISIVGGTTAPTTYSRLITQRFERARGIALGIAACTPAAVAAASIPSLSHFIDEHGWRAGYRLLALCAAVLGIIAVLLIPRGSDVPRNVGARGPTRGNSRRLLGSTPFQLMAAAILLGNLSFTLQTSQLKVLLLDRGIASDGGSFAVSLFAFSVIAGRLLCGLALDRFAAHAVATVSLGLPALGLCVLATGLRTPPVIDGAVLLLGLSLGGEGDVMAYLVAKFFPSALYSTALGSMLGALGLSVAVGSILLSVTLKSTGSFMPFIMGSALAALLGSALMYSLKRQLPLTFAA